MIQARNLKKSFGPQRVLEGVNLCIREGESVVIIGRSGGGKSILLKHLVGLIQPDSGEVIIDGENIVGMDERRLLDVRHKFGMLFQSAALFDSMTVEENVALGVRYHRTFPEPEIRKRVAARLEMVGLPDTQKLKPAELSGGMKKRVGLARALMTDPEFILYDEPTSGLDPVTADTINDLIIACAEKLGVTSIVVTHDMASAGKVGHRIAMLEDGRVIFSGTPEEMRHSSEPLVQKFIAGSRG